MPLYKGDRIWIIGASSGIGYALAKELASRGATLVLSARDEVKLNALRIEIGSSHTVLPLDVTNVLSFKEVAVHVKDSFKKLDRVIYLAAAYQPMSLLEMDTAIVDSIIDTNLKGSFNFVQAISPFIKDGTIGQIALCGSVAGYIGLPNGQPYSATKAAIINLTQSLRAELSSEIDVKLISPGFVRTDLTNKNTFTMPMMIEPEQAAKDIADGLLSSSFEIHFPKVFTQYMKLMALLPHNLYFWLVKKLG